MSHPPSVRTNIIWGWADHAIGLFVGLFMMPFVLHTLGDESYGTWLFINSIAGYSGLLYLGFGQTICRFTSTYHTQQDWDRLNHVSSVVFGIYMVTGAIALAISGLLSWLVPSLDCFSSMPAGEIRLVVLLTGLTVALSIVGSVFGGILMGTQRFDQYRGISIASAIIRVALVVLFLKHESGLVRLAVVFTIVTILENAAYITLAYRGVPTLRIDLRSVFKEGVGEYFQFGMLSFLNTIASQVLAVTDTVIIGIYFGPSHIVPFYIALRLSRFVGQPINQIAGVFMPRAGELHTQNNTRQLRKLLALGVGVSFLMTAGVLIGAAWFGETVIKTSVGPSYELSHNLLLILLFAQLVVIPTQVIRSVLYGVGNVRLPAMLYLTEAICNVVLTLLLIKPFGLIGVVTATVIPVFLIELFILAPYGLRTLGISGSEFVRECLGPQILPLLALSIYSAVLANTIAVPDTWPAVIAVTAGGGLTLVAVWSARHYGLKAWDTSHAVSST